MRTRWLVTGAGALTLAVVVGAWVGPLQVSRGVTADGVTLVSIDAEGRRLPTWQIAMSGDGRYIVFGSQGQIVVKDLQSGSVVPACGGCGSPALSHDGRFLAFVGGDGGLAADPRPRKNDVFVKDLQTGAVRAASGGPTFAKERGAYRPSISADGRTVAFSTGSGVSPKQQAWVVDETGKTRAVGPRSSYAPKLSADGNTVVFEVDGDRTGAPSSIGGARRIGIQDLRTNTQTWLDELVGLPISVNPAYITYSAPSADGARLAFAVQLHGAFPITMSSPSFAERELPELLGVYVADLRTGTVVHRIRNHSGQIANGRSPELSADGQHLIFASGDDRMAVSEDPGTDVFLADLGSGETRRISPARDLGTDFYGAPLRRIQEP